MLFLILERASTITLFIEVVIIVLDTPPPPSPCSPAPLLEQLTNIYTKFDRRKGKKYEIYQRTPMHVHVCVCVAKRQTKLQATLEN